MKEKSVLPKVSWLILTPRCNNRCKQCYQGNTILPLNCDMPIEFAKRILPLLGKIGVKNCILIGGEPTLHPKLNQIIEDGSISGVKISVVTNGIIFAKKEKIEAALKSGLDGFTVSIEGQNNEIHDAQTQRKGSFRKCISALKNGLELKVRVASITTVSRSTKDFLIEIYKSMREIGLSTIVFNICTPSLDISNKECLISLKEAAEKLEDLFLFVRNDIEKQGIKVKLVTPLPQCMFKQDYVSAMKELGFLRKGCGCQMFYGNGIAFNFNGDILPCCHWIGCSLGNVYELWGKTGNIPVDEFKEWWYERDPAVFRKNLTKYPSSKCVDCIYWGSHCVGGCPLFWLAFNAEKEIASIS